MSDKPKAERDAERMLEEYLAHVEGSLTLDAAATQLITAVDRLLTESLGPTLAEDWIRNYFGLPLQRSRHPAIGSAWNVEGTGAAPAERDDAA